MLRWFLLLGCAAGQGPQECPAELVNFTRCGPLAPEDLVGNASLTCAARPGNLDISQAEVWAFRCGLPVEVRVGLTLSLTGPKSDANFTNMVLTALSEYSSQISTRQVDMRMEDITLAEVHSCLRFCVLDDESSVRKSAELYRYFASADESLKMDLLLGPGSGEFRHAAAQVAEEFQKPAVLWSMPSEIMELLQPKASQEAQSQERFLPTGAFGVGYDVLLGLPDFSCGALAPPAGYRLRAAAELLDCGRPCDPVADLDFCFAVAHSFSVSGPGWSPPTHLTLDPAGSCISGVTNFGGQGMVDIILHTSRPLEYVTFRVEHATNDSHQALPRLIVEGHVALPGDAVFDLLPDGSEVFFYHNASQTSNSSWSLCLREQCEVLCPGKAVKKACPGLVCVPEDYAECCPRISTSNGPLSTAVHQPSAVFDLLPPLSTWARDALSQAAVASQPRFICIAESRTVFVDLCEDYQTYASEVLNFELYEGGVQATDVSQIFGAASLVGRLDPRPTAVMLCGSFDLFVGFVGSNRVLEVRHPYVITCLPFGNLLELVTSGLQEGFRLLEPQPWPSAAFLRGFENEGPAVTAQANPSLNMKFAELEEKATAQYGSIPIQLVWLSSAWQILDQVGIEHAVRALEGATIPDYTRFVTKQSMYGARFPTFMGYIIFLPTGKRIVLRTDVATRQMVPPVLPSSQILMTAAWPTITAMLFASDFRVADSTAPALPPAPLGDLVQYYPCPPGCVVAGFSCQACSPGTYRSRIMDVCGACLNGTYQDSWAGMVCQPCPDGATCQKDRPPVPIWGHYVVENEELLRLTGKWMGPDACSSLPGGGLEKLAFADTYIWESSKRIPRWRVGLCEHAEKCEVGNVCLEFHTGNGCMKCSPSASKLWGDGPFCKGCPADWEQWLNALARAAVQIVFAELLSRATRSSAESLRRLGADLLLTLLHAWQMLWLLNKSVQEFHATHVTYLVLTPVDYLMTPWLLPLADCTQHAYSADGVWLQSVAVISSGLTLYVFFFVPYLCFCCSAEAKQSLRRRCISLNQVLLPNLLYWSVTLLEPCADVKPLFSIADADNCQEPVNLATNPSLLTVLAVLIVVYLQGYAVWACRRDHSRSDARKQFGLLFNPTRSDYYMWCFFEGLYILVLCIASASVPKGTGFLRQAICLALYVSYFILLVSLDPFLPVSARALYHIKRDIAIEQFALSIILLFERLMDLLSLPETLGYEFSYHSLTLDICVSVAVIRVTILILYKYARNSIIVTKSIQSDTGGLPEIAQKPLDVVRALVGAKSLQVHRKDNQFTLETDMMSSFQRRDFLCSLEMVLEHELSKDSALNLQVVVGLVNEATVQIIGSHRVALNKHLNTMAGSIPGGWDPSSVDKQAFVLLPEELSGAVQDMCHQDQRNSGPGLHEIDTTGLDLLMGGADSSSSEEEEEDRHVEVYTDTHEEVLCRKARKGPDMDQEHTENKVEMPDFLQRLHRLAHDADEEVDRKMRLLAYEIRAVKWPPNAADSWKEVKSFAEKVREIPQLVDMLCATTRDENVSLVGAEMRVKRRLKHLKTKRRASMMGLPDRDDAGVTPPEEVVMLFGRDEGDEADPAGIDASQALSHQPSMLPRLISKGGYYGAKSEDGSSSSSSSSKEDPVSQPSGRLRKAKRGVLREGGWKPDSTQVGVGRSMAMLHRHNAVNFNR